MKSKKATAGVHSDTIHASIAEQASAFRALAKDLYANPEVAFEERHAAEAQTQLLETLGFKIVRPFGGLETAYKATWGNSGPCFMFVAEYDALPGMGHACGHNLIASASIAAAYATKCHLEAHKIPGTVMVVGTPGEEGKGGKILLIRDRVFIRVDAAIMAHPADRTHTDDGMLSVRRYDVIFHGVSSHAATAPECGRNALDGVTLLFNGVNAWRQHLPEHCRVHGIITGGGTAPNVVPDLTSARFYLRADSDAYAKEMEKRFKDIVKGAALMTATKYRIQEEDTSYRPTRINVPLNQAFAEAVPGAGLTLQDTGMSGRGSSDFGNLSQVLPGAHVAFQITKEPTPWHTLEFAKAASTEFAMDQALKAAEAMAHVAVKFFSDDDFRKAVKANFDANA